METRIRPSVQSPEVGTPGGGVVLGTLDATPLEFWLGVQEGGVVQLDDLVVAETALPDGQRVRFYGVVDQVRKRYEGTYYDNDAFRVTDGTLPADVSYAAHVQVTRIDPEVFVPPSPGDRAWVVRGEEFQRALYFDTFARRIPIGLTRTGEPVYANLEFLDGTRGAHVSISGVSGVATKTSYATFLLYALFHSGALGTDATNAKALVFNVKGEDLLWLDQPNARLDEGTRAEYARLGLPAGPFRSVAFYAPAKRHSRVPVPDVGSRSTGVRPYLWTLREFCREGLLRFCFAEAEDARAQISFVVARVENQLRRMAEQGDPEDPGLTVDGRRITTFWEFVDHLNALVEGWVQAAPGTLDAFRRRLHAAADRMGHLVRGDLDAVGWRIDWQAQQVTVVDLHTLSGQAQMFVVGVLLKRMMEEKERRGTSRPLVFVVLDELNKYAPREGSSPIRDVLLDIAERGRSLGVSLFGCQQTASEVERRILANAALKVVGRLDPAEAERGEYGWLTRTARLRAQLLQPGTMIVSQPDIPTPLLLRFPFPAWATRRSEAALPEDEDPFARL
ncbi:MAG: ATP-binding protein [Armatimonadota bacterium]|nr:ATP-binding protein [Armatimonadota bacterium]MDR7443084.1 ATP-binding protein [Armatimonadota bacterium]MDR7571177.1 ATP-binding protein [Armatimonadota bacterium]MDR7614462.1 ATP-binding protein [Armatimonadota bacterium]